MSVLKYLNKILPGIELPRAEQEEKSSEERRATRKFVKKIDRLNRNGIKIAAYYVEISRYRLLGVI